MPYPSGHAGIERIAARGGGGEGRFEIIRGSRFRACDTHNTHRYESNVTLNRVDDAALLVVPSAALGGSRVSP